MADAPCSRSLPDRKNPGVFSLHGCLRLETPAAMSRPRRSIGAYGPGPSWRSAAANVDNVSYEEYHPYGTTAWWTDPGSTVSQKRYRYTGKEKDEESGLYYHGARFLAPWLGRWTTADPLPDNRGARGYVYGANRPTVMVDPDGAEPTLGCGPSNQAPTTLEEQFVQGVTSPSVGQAGWQSARLSTDQAQEVVRGTRAVNAVAPGVGDMLLETYAPGELWLEQESSFLTPIVGAGNAADTSHGNYTYLAPDFFSNPDYTDEVTGLVIIHELPHWYGSEARGLKSGKENSPEEARAYALEFAVGERMLAVSGPDAAVEKRLKTVRDHIQYESDPQQWDWYRENVAVLRLLLQKVSTDQGPEDPRTVPKLQNPTTNEVWDFGQVTVDQAHAALEAFIKGTEDNDVLDKLHIWVQQNPELKKGILPESD